MKPKTAESTLHLDAPTEAGHFVHLLPQVIASREGFIEDCLAPVYDEELAGVLGASPSRIQEFAAGRNCARGALRIIGHAPAPIPT